MAPWLPCCRGTRRWSRLVAAASSLILFVPLTSANAVDPEVGDRRSTAAGPSCSSTEAAGTLDLACLVQRDLSVERAELAPRAGQQSARDGQQQLAKKQPLPIPEPSDSIEPQDETLQPSTSPSPAPSGAPPAPQDPSQPAPQDPSQPAPESSEPQDTGRPRGVAAAQAAGVGRNAHGDFGVFIGALISNMLVLVASAVFFSLARRWFPQMYANNVRSAEEGGFESAPFVPSDRLLGWIPAGLGVSVEQTKDCSGLDSALLLEYANFALKLLAALGVPLLLVLSPLHYWWGNTAEDTDRLSRIGLNNIKNGSWLFTFHAFVVWYVVLVTESMVFSSLRRFLSLRFQWLEALGPPRSTTVLVEGLPERLRSDKALAEHFGRYFPYEAAVESAYVVKHTATLQPMVKELEAKKLALEKANYKKTLKDNILDRMSGGGRRGAGENTRSQRLSASGTDAEVKEKLEAELKELKDQCEELEAEVAQLEGVTKAERTRILAAANSPLEEEEIPGMEGKKMLALSQQARDVCARSGFVTFANEREALLAMTARCSADADDMVLSVPPSPTDIRYDDLAVSPVRRLVFGFLGCGAIFGIFCSYTPFIVAFSTLTQLENLEKLGAFHALMVKAPTIATLVQGVFSTLGIVLFMSLLPTILMWIFRAFFTMKAEAWSQLKLQIVYFWFLFVFILLITAVGASLLGRVYYLIRHPMETSGVLADSLPTATHFYLNYLLMQWVVHAMNLTRYIQLTKFFLFKATFGAERAVELSEPEDQDYYGFGARTARWSLDLLLALVFCSITPLMTLVCFLNFLITRVVYGYLIVFAETRKHDLGGPFFMEQMKQVQFGLIVYLLLMMGVFARRAATWLPVVIAGLALIPVLLSFKRLYAVAWDTLTLDFVTSPGFQKRSKARNDVYRGQGSKQERYIQPELSEEDTRAVGRKSEKL